MERELTEADLPGLQEDVSRLQREYDDAVVVKHNLDNEVKSCSERLKAATDLLGRLVPCSERATFGWKTRETLCTVLDYS